MGAGNYYTSDIDKEPTFWVNLPHSEGADQLDYEHEHELFLENLDYTLDTLCKSNKFKAWDFYNDQGKRTLECGLYIIELQHTYYGDGLVFNFKAVDNYDYCGFIDANANLALANYPATFNKWKKALLKAGLSLRMASSAWTSFELCIEE